MSPPRSASRPDDVVPGPLGALDERTAEALDRVRPGLVERLARRDVGIDLGPTQGAEPHPADLDDPVHVAVTRNGDPGEDLVGAPRQPAEHGAGVVGVCRFAQELAVERHDRVRADHDGLGMSFGDVAGLVVRQPGDVARSRFVRQRGLVDVGRLDRELVAGVGHELEATG